MVLSAVILRDYTTEIKDLVLSLGDVVEEEDVLGGMNKELGNIVSAARTLTRNPH